VACTGSATAAPRGATCNLTTHKIAISTGSPAIFGDRRQSPYIPAEMELGGGMTSIDEITENFELLDEWDDRYRYVIELGRALPPLPENAHSEANKVRGCASQVWLLTHVKPDGASGPTLSFEGDSDAHIVKGLIAILLALYSDKPAKHILDTDAIALFDRLGLRENLTPQRSNGLRAMVDRIRADAKAALAPA
jgi:cysteine desulfuration protein SufE